MPGSIRLFVDVPLAPGATVELAPAQAHQLRAVLRRRPGDTVALWNGRDGEFSAVLATLDRDRATAELGTQIRVQSASPDCWLVFAPLRRDLTELVAQKATELGVSALLPVTTRRTNPGGVNPGRLRAISTEAAEQCERLDIPAVQPLRPLDELLAAWNADRPLFLCAERADAPAILAVTGPCALLIGPEGGFDPAELDRMGRLAFVRAVSLGPRILRAETAAIAGLARLLAHPH